MKEILRRALIVAWLGILAILGIAMTLSPTNGNSWQIPLFLAVPTWAVQFITLGLVNPLGLIFRA
jgi:hypothetical protein